MKEVKILLIIIIVLGLILGIKFFMKKNNKETYREKFSEISLEELKQIASKSENVNNYLCEYNLNGQNYIVKFKDNKEYYIGKTPQSGRTVANWRDYEAGEWIITEEENNSIAIIHKNSTNIKYEFKLKTFLENLELFNEAYINKQILKGVFKEKGRNDYNGINCMIIEKEVTDEDGNDVKIELWVDDKTGFIIKHIEKKNDEDIYYLESNIKFDCVTDEEVSRPDLSKYKQIVNE